MNYYINEMPVSQEIFMMKLKFQLLLNGYPHTEHEAVINKTLGKNGRLKLRDMAFEIKKETE